MAFSNDVCSEGSLLIDWSRGSTAFIFTTATTTISPRIKDVLEGKEYLKDGKVIGKDVKETRSPQRYGYTDLDFFMEENNYISTEVIYAQ